MRNREREFECGLRWESVFYARAFFSLSLSVRYTDELLSSVLFSLCMVLWCDFIFFCVYVCLSQSYPFLANVTLSTLIPLQSTMRIRLLFGGWWLFCSHRNIASLSTASHFISHARLRFTGFFYSSLFSLTHSLHHTHSNIFPRSSASIVRRFLRFYIICVAFRCRFCALIFVTYYISHLIRQIVVTACLASTKMEIIEVTFLSFFTLSLLVSEYFESFDTEIAFFYFRSSRFTWFNHVGCFKMIVSTWTVTHFKL